MNYRNYPIRLKTRHRIKGRYRIRARRFSSPEQAASYIRILSSQTKITEFRIHGVCFSWPKWNDSYQPSFENVKSYIAECLDFYKAFHEGIK